MTVKKLLDTILCDVTIPLTVMWWCLCLLKIVSSFRSSEYEICLNIEFSTEKKICRLISLYRSWSQNQEEFNKFIDNLESNLETVSLFNPFLTILISDFNATCATWYSKDNSTTEGLKQRLLTSQFGLNQIINEPTHIMKNSSTCIDLLFTSQINFN